MPKLLAIKFSNVCYYGYLASSNHNGDGSSRCLSSEGSFENKIFERLILRLSDIIIDEVHERSTDIDFLLVILKDLLKKRTALRFVYNERDFLVV